ncbi:tigger transposable element-derived protein 6-like [Ixodes scapularis]
MDGTEKTNLLVIGKAKRPTCLHKVHVLVDWDPNQSLWMMRDIFNKWLLDFNGKMKKEKRKVLLFLDNCSSHMQVPELPVTKVVYLPPCTTSKLQPIDQGVVHFVKSRYCMRLAERLLYNMQQNTDSVTDLKFAVQVVSAVWEQVEAHVIKNCFQKAGFVFNDKDSSDYVNVDADFVSMEQLTDAEIVAQVRGISICDQEEEEAGDKEAVTRKVTTAEALDHINTLKCFFEENGAPEEVVCLVKMEHGIVANAVSCTAQSEITTSFQNA